MNVDFSETLDYPAISIIKLLVYHNNLTDNSRKIQTRIAKVFDEKNTEFE